MILLPTYKEASDRRIEGKASPVDVFISEHEPQILRQMGEKGVDRWRRDLLAAVEWVANQGCVHAST